HGGEARRAPVIPLFGGKLVPASALPATRGEESPRRRDMTTVDAGNRRETDRDRDEAVSDRPSSDPSSPDPSSPDPDQVRTAGEESLVRKLRARSLSISEARQVLRGHDLTQSQIDDVIDDFCRRGYLDDSILAEQLVISGIERKGQGRVALSRALAQRGIPRDVIDMALGDLPDDDAERALEFARTKARSMARLEYDTALRRLTGQLARRGYGGSVAMSAARTALSEATLGKATSGVRFVDSE
ncbi:regulatory protein RecX, partial [Microbacterium sp. AGC85]